MKRIKVALLVGEFFSNSLPFNSGKGGYGMLARNYITEYLPNDSVDIDTICGYNSRDELLIHLVDDKKNVLFLPKPSNNFIIRTLRRALKLADKKIKKIVEQYDLFISIEFTSISYDVLKLISKKQKVILWIQDPRPVSDWKEIDSMKAMQQTGYRPNKKVSNLVNKLNKHKQLHLVSQGMFLAPKAIELYQLPANTQIDFLPNPIQLPILTLDDIRKKKNNVIALGRLDSVKRPWITAEVAKRLPEYNFYFLGQFHEKNMIQIMDKYKSLSNCYFVGHIEGIEKERFLKEAKILINTSIHEAVPVSFLEAMSYGTLLVSNRNPDCLTSKFGVHINQVNGDGLASVNEFVFAIKKIMQDVDFFEETSLAARKYVEEIHNIDSFKRNMSAIIGKILLNE